MKYVVCGVWLSEGDGDSDRFAHPFTAKDAETAEAKCRKQLIKEDPSTRFVIAAVIDDKGRIVL